MSTEAPRVLRVAGPLVEVENFPAATMNDMVALGEHNSPAEIVAIRGDRLALQAYEYTGGLGPGVPVTPLYQPLSAQLGPNLLGGVFDGLLRPLATAATWLSPGAYRRPQARTWHFRPEVAVGDDIEPGHVLGAITDACPLEYRILAPPSVAGRVEAVAAEGGYPADAVVATVAATAVRITGSWPVRRARPHRGRHGHPTPLHTGQRALDLLFPPAMGGTAAVPGGFGTGKTVMLQQVAKWCDADVIVYVGCGERGNEMADIVTELYTLTDPRTGGRLADRTVIIANTSNMPMMAREVGIYTGVTVAEYFRDMGYHVVVIADSTSRWAEALREFASRTGELPTEEGYPANLASALAAFYERAGAVTTLGGRLGSVTVIGAVSPPGGDLSEPVTADTERFVRCRWTLDRDLAYSRHYPAVSWSASFSRDAEVLAAEYRSVDPQWSARRARVVGLLAESDRLSALVELVGVDALPAHQRITLLAGRLIREGLLQQSALSDNDSYCSPQKTAALVEAVLAVVDRCHELVTQDVAAARIEEFDFGPLVRVRDLSGPHDTTAAHRCRDKILTELGELGASS